MNANLDTVYSTRGPPVCKKPIIQGIPIQPATIPAHATRGTPKQSSLRGELNLFAISLYLLEFDCDEKTTTAIIGQISLFFWGYHLQFQKFNIG
jgi:hypothetical protein